MLKKFVPLSSPESPSKNPHEVRTFLGDVTRAPEWNVELCERNRCCDRPANSTISKVMTIEDEIRRLHHRAKASVYIRPTGGSRPCDPAKVFTWCVMPQRTPRALRRQASAREHYVMTQEDLAAHVHDATQEVKPTYSVVKLNSPVDVNAPTGEQVSEEEEGEEEDDEGGKRWRVVKPQLGSPACSLQAIYMPTQKVLEVKRPKSGMFHNETEQPQVDEAIPYSEYNPRVLQQQFDEQGLKCANLIEGRNENDLWTWNMGLQKRESDLNNALLQAAIPRLDCDNLELTIYQIPKDLQKTFMVQFVYGNCAIPPEPKPKKKRYYNRPIEIGCIYAAFIESFVLNPDFWLAETLDCVMATGEKLVQKSTTINYKSETDFDILPQLTDKHAVLGLKLHYTGSIMDEPNIYKTLSLYFHKFNAAVLCTQDLYLLIWKRCRNAYFVYDPNGRNEAGQRDHEEGKSTLIILRYIENLVYLIVNFSNLDTCADFNLYEINLTNYGKITHPLSMKPAPKETRKLWAVVNSRYAIIPAALGGLQQPNTGKEHNPSMIMSLLALLYSDIERASMWRVEVIDELLKFGRAYYKSLSKHAKLKRGQHYNIVDLPEQLMMGAYRASLQKRPFLVTGTVADCQSYLDSQLVMGMKHLFTSEWESGLIQVDNLVLAVFRDVQFFYAFDPFRRGRAGQVLDPEDYMCKGVACLQMHTNFDSLCRIVHQKAIQMRRGGRFFIHGIKVGCIKPVYALGGIVNRFAKLQLTLPPCREDKIEGVEETTADGTPLPTGEGGDIIPPPAEPAPGKKGKGKDKKKKKKVERKYSIESIPEDQRIEEYDNEDVVNDVLEEVICEVLHKLCEPTPPRPRLYKRAAKVLLQSDKTYLQALRHQLKHGEDYDNFYAAHQLQPATPPQPMTLEEELLVPSNYEKLPDGSWVIFGTTHIPQVAEEVYKLSGLLSALAAAAVSTKYRISTWNSQLVEFALQAANNFGEQYQDYERSLRAVLDKNLPRIAIGQTTYLPLVQKTVNSTSAAGSTKSLRQVILDTLIAHSHMLVICQRFSCLIIKRYNFLYMFIGFPCDPVGYRRFGSGPGCILRFVELDGLIRRIERGCNPQGCEVTNFAVVAVKVVDVTRDPPNRYLQYTRYEQEELLREEQAFEERLKQHKLAKMQFLDEELRKENERITEFLREKEEHLGRSGQGRSVPQQTSRRRVDFDSEGVEEDYEEYNEENEQESEATVELKHKPGRKIPKYQPARYKPRTVLYGYRMREKDCVYKIQGSLALDGRHEAYLDRIKPCFFASTLAVLYAILRPLNQWNSQRVDRVIEGAKLIASRVSNMTTSEEHKLRNVTIDDYQFDVITSTFNPLGAYQHAAENVINRTVLSRNYMLLQLSNCTYAIYHDDYFHLFDPYGAMALAHENDDVEDDDNDESGGGGGKKGGKKLCPRGPKRYGERDTASWVLFADVESMLRYITKRSVNPYWNRDDEFQVHVIDIISYKRAPAPARVLQLMTDMAVPPGCDATAYGEEETGELCAQNESVCWLDLEHCLPVWSRMHRRNTAGRYRNLPVTKLKRYDIEIDGRLWSLWGNLHPQAPVFAANSRGRQYLACNVVACCAASIYRLAEWSPQLLDNIVISGDRYHRDSLANIRQQDYEFSLEDLNLELTLENIGFVLHLEHVAYGRLYCVPTRTRMNLADALMYFFTNFRMGVLQCQRRSLAFGRMPGHDGGYFMFDCQSREHPLFPKGQGAAYVLRTKQLQVLLYCIVVTLNVPYHNVGFTLHKVDLMREGTSIDDDEGDEEQATNAD